MSETTLPCAAAAAGGWPVRERAPGGVPVELTDAYPKFKAAINVNPGTEPVWGEVIQRAVPLLALHSKDLSVAGELGFALWMDQRFEGLQDALAIWLDLLSDRIWPHTWPRARGERAGQLLRFLMRIEVSLRDPAQRISRPGERVAQDGVVETLRTLESEATRQLEGASCTDDIRRLRRAILDLGGPPPQKAQQTKVAGDSAEGLAGQLVSARDQLTETLAGQASLDVVEPWWNALQNPLWQVLRAVVGAWPEIPSTWRMARTLAWGLEPPPQGTRGLLAVDLRLAQDLAAATGRLSQVGGSASWFELEAIWQERGHVRWVDPHRVAAERLRRAGLDASACAVERVTAQWLDRARGLVDLRCDDEARTRLADDLTRKWASRLAPPPGPDLPRPSAVAPTYSAVALTNQAEKLRKEVRGALAPAGGAPGSTPADILAALTLLKAPTEALVQLLCALDPASLVTANLAISWPTILAASAVLARGEPAPGSARLPPPGEDLLYEVAQEGGDPTVRAGALWAAVAAHPWWLDLYRALAETLPLAGGQAAASVVADCAEELTLAWPALVDATFENGSPLADQATRAWVSGLRRRADTPRAPAPVEKPAPTLQPPTRSDLLDTGSTPLPAEVAEEPAGDHWDAGLHLVTAGQVRDGLQALEQVAQRVQGGRPRFVGALRLADALLGAGERDAALAILAALESASLRHDLDHWEPALAAALTRARWKAQAEAGETTAQTPSSSNELLVRAASQGLYGLLIPPDGP